MHFDERVTLSESPHPMRLPTAILALTFLILSTLTANAQTYKNPQSLITALYAYDTAETADDAPSPYTPFFSRSLNELLQNDADATPEGEVGAIDFDPVISGQDGEAKNVEMSPPILMDDRAELEVSFRNGDEAVTLYYTLVREGKGWKVDDIANQQGENPWSVRALLGG